MKVADVVVRRREIGVVAGGAGRDAFPDQSVDARSGDAVLE
jgi:hypothetical protein